MAGQRRTRRSYDEMIQALRHKISQLEDRKKAKALRSDPALKLASKLVRSLRKAEDAFAHAKRTDLANAAKAAYLSLEGNLRSPSKS